MGERLPGGNAGGAMLVEGTVRRPAGAWTPAVHALLSHLHDHGFDRAPRPLGYDSEGRETLTYLIGETVGDLKPWPTWVHADETLIQVADWLRDYHHAVADFIPPADASWRLGGTWESGQIICHNDAAPYNAAWRNGRLAGVFDWDFAGPALPEWDVAFTACAWVPLHARHVATAEGFTDFSERPRRLATFLDRYGWEGEISDLLRVLDRRLEAHGNEVARLADAGDALFQRLVDRGVLRDVGIARAELADFPH
ncbi:MAG TPA: phosphotransferase [Mycobacteriales bacterium]|nr:phosphotransferase [Mycobacteriales bacterium]